MHHQKNLIYLIRGLGFQKRMRNYLYKGNSARIYRLVKFYWTAIIREIIKQNSINKRIFDNKTT